MKVLTLHDAVSSDSRPDELDALIQARVVSDALHRLGHTAETAAFERDLDRSEAILRRSRPDLVFNLVDRDGGSICPRR
jgi:hypothetical protein